MKLEDNFRKKLEERRIQPTACAWDRIEGKLEVAVGKKKSKAVLWMAIAASFIAGVFLTAVLFGGGEAVPTNEMVTTPENQETTEKVQTQLVTPLLKNGAQKAIVTRQAEERETFAAPLRNSKKSNKNTAPSIVKVEPQYEPKTISSEAVQLIAQTAIEDSIFKRAAQQEEERIAMINAEVESLLQDAQRAIVSDRLHTEASTRVDATALLLDVEAEVDPETFKDKIYQTLKKQFNLARQAVAAKDN